LKELLTQLKTKIKDKINRGTAEALSKMNKGISNIRKHDSLWPIDIVDIVGKTSNFEKYFIDLSATTFDFVRLPIKSKKSWYTNESLLERGIAIGGVIGSESKALGVTDLEGFINSISLLHYKLNNIKGKIIIINDNGRNYLDTSKSDVPTLSKSQVEINIDIDKLMKETDGITVSSVQELEKALVSDKKVINVKIDPDFESVILPRI
ncbi:acetolactate synthase, partial [Sulfolobus sp. F1]